MSDSTQIEELRKVYLPLGRPEKCDRCSKSGVKLHLCSSCGERIYCSAECQQTDWPNHKRQCGKTDRIDITAFFPLLACLIDVSRIHPKKPLCPALNHKILNSPNPNVNSVVSFPDKSSASLIILGEKIKEPEYGSETWWPTAASDAIRRKMMRRFVTEGYLLPALIATCVSLLAEMYTTTAVSAADSPDGELKRRVRLQFHKSPISDFGIAKGITDVKHQDKFAYYNVLDGDFMKGQDPDDHYWIYFTTTSGEEFLLDCGMYTFNFCMMVSSKPYSKYGLVLPDFVPAYFRDRVYRDNAPKLQTETQRFSVLRNAGIHEAIRYSRKYFRNMDAKVIGDFMNLVAGRNCDETEKELLMQYCLNDCEVINMNLVTREYLNFPAEPGVAIDADPGEMDNTPPAEDEAWWKYMKKWNKKQRAGKITSEQLGEAFRSWKEKRYPEGVDKSKVKKAPAIGGA